MSKFLDKTGLTTFWSKVKSYLTENFASKDILGNLIVTDTTISSMDSITILPQGDMNIEASTVNIGDGASTVNIGNSGSFSSVNINGELNLNNSTGDTVCTLDPEEPNFNFNGGGTFKSLTVNGNPITGEVATTTTNGLMSAEDKTNFDNLYPHALWDNYLNSCNNSKFQIKKYCTYDSSWESAAVLNWHIVPEDTYTDSVFTDGWLELGVMGNYLETANEAFANYAGMPFYNVNGTKRSDSKKYLTWMTPFGIRFEQGNNRVWTYRGAYMVATDASGNDYDPWTITLPDKKSGTLALIEDVSSCITKLTGATISATDSFTIRLLGTHFDSSLDDDLLDYTIPAATSIAAGVVKVSSGNKCWGLVPQVTTDGVMEVGKYLDFHNSDDDSVDYSTRLYCDGDNSNSVALPKSSGELALINKVPVIGIGGNYWGDSVTDFCAGDGITFTTTTEDDGNDTRESLKRHVTISSSLPSGEFTVNDSDVNETTISGEGLYKIIILNTAKLSNYTADVYITSDGSIIIAYSLGLGAGDMTYDSTSNVLTVNIGTSPSYTIKKWVKLC